MRRVLTLMVSVLQVYLSVSCPASSCVLCSEDAIACSQLSRIIEVPNSLKVLMLTDGLINTVDVITTNSTISNMSILVLSNNIISTIVNTAFRNLTLLKTLMLDHNLISSQSLDSSTFSYLSNLETLNLDHNTLQNIDGSWFQNSTSLKTLQLQGNVLTSLNSSTFAISDLRNLEILDLSGNLISYLGRDSFRKIPQLHSLDLSRNRLQNAPDAFSYLTSLSLLNLDLNFWNCTCQLTGLTSFLVSYVRDPNNVLYNGGKMACESLENPAVKSVLQLNETNCGRANSKNVTVKAATSLVTAQHYVRDVVIAATCSFLGGVGISLAVVAVVYWKLGKRFRFGKELEQSIPASTQWEFSEDKDALSMAFNSNYQTLDKDSASYDRMANAVENRFICHNCSSATIGTGLQEERERERESSLRKNNHVASHKNREDDWPGLTNSDQSQNIENHSPLQSRLRDLRAQRQAEKRTGQTNIHHFHRQENVSENAVPKDASTVRMQQLSLRRHISVSQRQTFTPEGQMHQNIKRGQEEFPVFQAVHCLHCHQTYEYKLIGNENQDASFRNHQVASLPNGGGISEAILYRDTLNYNKTRVGQSQGREQRSVTFHLSGSNDQTLILPNKVEDGPYRINRTKMPKMDGFLDEKEYPKPDKVQVKINRNSSCKPPKNHKTRTLRVKLNLNPLRRSRVHPKSGFVQEVTEVLDTEFGKAKKGKLRKKKDDVSSNQKSKNDEIKSKSPPTGDVSTEEKVAMEEQENEPMSKSKTEIKNDEGSGSIPGDNNDNQKENAAKSGTDFPDRVPENKDISASKSHQNMQNPELQSVPPIQGLDLLTQNTNNGSAEPIRTENTADSQLNSTQSLSTFQPIVEPNENPKDEGELVNISSPISDVSSVVQEFLPSGDGSPKRRIRLIIPEKSSNRPQTALDKKIR